MSLFSESEDRKRKKHARWLQGIEKTITKKTRKLNCLIKIEPVTSDSEQEILTSFHNAFGHLVDYGMVLSGELHQCRFSAIIPFRCERLVMHFEIPVRINWEAYYMLKGSGYSIKGKWVCQPKNKKRSRQMNRKFPKPIVGQFTKTGVFTIEEGGSIYAGEGENTELSINALCPKGKEARTVSDALNRIGDVVLLLNEWSEK